MENSANGKRLIGEIHNTLITFPVDIALVDELVKEFEAQPQNGVIPEQVKQHIERARQKLN